MLMVRKFTLAAAFALAVASHAMADDNVAVVYLDGTTTQSYTLTKAEVSKIELSGDKVSVVTASGDTKSFDKSAVQKIDLHAATDGIRQLRTAKDVVISTNGYAVTVSGLDNGAQVSLYDLAGRLVTKTTVTNGAATVDASAISGAAIVKAAGKAVKLIKK